MVRGRKVNSSGEKSKQLLLEKAIELFSKHGYHQTKISDIVKAADLTQPTFYLYFQSKDSLFTDLNEKFRNSLLEILEHNISDAKGEVQHIRHLLQHKLASIFSYFVENENLTKIGFYEANEANEVKVTFINFLVDVFSKAEGERWLASTVDKKVLAESLVGSVERLTLTQLLTKKKSPEQLANDLVNIYLRTVDEQQFVTK